MTASAAPHDPPVAGAEPFKQERRHQARDQDADGRPDIKQGEVERLPPRLGLRDVAGQRAAGDEGKGGGDAGYQARETEDDDVPRSPMRAPAKAHKPRHSS